MAKNNAIRNTITDNVIIAEIQRLEMILMKCPYVGDIRPTSNHALTAHCLEPTLLIIDHEGEDAICPYRRVNDKFPYCQAKYKSTKLQNEYNIVTID